MDSFFLRRNCKYLFFSFIFFIILSLGFISCAQNVPEINGVNSSIVFSYSDNDSLPEARLSMFIQNRNDVRRCSRINVKAIESDYEWNTTDIKKIGYSDYKWAGNMTFAVPEGEVIPTGRYEISYFNADLNEDKVSINVYYDKNIYNMKADELDSYMESRGEKKIAIYDSDFVLLYFGSKSDEFSTKESILKLYTNCMYIQDVWLTNEKNVICILPMDKIN